MQRLVLNNNLIENLHNSNIGLFMTMGNILIIQLDNINTASEILTKGHLEIFSIDWELSAVSFSENDNITLQDYILQYNSKPLLINNTSLKNNIITFNCDLFSNNESKRCSINITYTGQITLVLND